MSAASRPRPGPGAGLILALVLALILAPGPAALAGAASPLERAGGGLVAEVIDGDTLVLDDGTVVRLVGIQAPKLPLGRAGFRPWPLAAKAKAALEALGLGHRVALAYGGRRRDRHGRALAHLYDEAGRWLQGELLAQGLARVYSFRDNRALVGEMLALECQARAAGRGIWRLNYYRPLGPEDTPRFIGSFQLVEGRVLEAAVVRGRAYLNFGADWRSDFTISISSKDRRRFKAAGIDTDGYAERKVRVRGWLKSYNGPMIEVTHPEQIEVLEE
jgi:endonuclease YncB( thermonuclease family)